MTRITETEMAYPTGLECNLCHHRELDPSGGLGAILTRSAWAQSMSSQERHVCERCYRGLEPMAREGYWRRHITGSRIEA
jgi:hypothetical protein